MEKKDSVQQALVDLPSNDKAVASSDTDEEVTVCGIGGCRPNICQKLATINIFTGALSVPLLLTSTLSTYVISQVTTLEKQFGLSSSQTGMLLANIDLGYGLVAIFIGYFAPRVHIPRILAVCVVLFGISGLICSLPHFLYGVEDIEDSESLNSSIPKKNMIGQLCIETIQSENCDSDESKISKSRAHATSALTIIGIGMFLQGAAQAPSHPFSVTYVDDNVVRTKTGYYIGILITVGIMGPALSFILGGLFTRLYVTLEATSLHPRHPKWVGAWWLGFIVFGIASVLASFPLFFFPRKLRGAPKLPAKQVKKGCKNTFNLIKEIKTYFGLLVKMLTNPIYLLLLMSVVTLLFAVGGMQSFLPKYIENQFGLEAWKANLIMAGLNLSTACVGTFVGGWMSKRFKMGALLALKWCCVLYFLVVIFFGLGFVFGCDQPDIVNTPGSAGENCLADCACNNIDYFPVCGSDNRNYFSPCHAGCDVYESGTYSNCTCIPGGEATAGSCYYSCPFLIPYLTAIGCSFLASTVSIVPGITAQIRCVTEEEKPLSIGIMTVVASLLGWMLSVMVIGRIIDTSCLIWDSKCGQKGACVLYDLADFRVKLHGVALGARAVSFLFILLALLVALKTKRLHPTPEETTTCIKDDDGALMAE